MKKIEVSVIIPVRTITPYVKETVFFLEKQTQKAFEIIIVTDGDEKINGAKVIASGEPTPAYKRNLGSTKARGEILAFLDDDSFPEADWLKNAIKIFEEGSQIASVCGPTLTPVSDNIFQKASGWVWASWLGSGGAGVYRNQVLSRREVVDFPSVNLLVRKEVFEKIGGFDIHHWPGEDTKLCLDIIKLNKKIVYDPGVLVYHHRRAVFLPHLKQISRYALRRGHFAKIFPETSFKIGYFFPSFFSYGLLLGILGAVIFPLLKYPAFLLLAVYFLLLFFSGLKVLLKEKNLFLTALVVFSIFLTHLVYGFLFPIGYFQKSLKTSAHKINLKEKTYIGG